MTYFLIAIILVLNASFCVQDVTLNSVDVESEVYLEEDDVAPESRRIDSMNTHIHKIAKMYLCSYPQTLNEGFDRNILVYGEKSWKFPSQDVNLTLAYPTHEVSKDIKPREHWIIGFKVILYLDGQESYGYVTSGGIMEDEITLSFVMESISSLSYQFWVYGVKKSQYSFIRGPIEDMCK